MAFSTPLRVLTYSLLASFCVNVWANAQVVLPCSNRTAINGTPFPSLIDATTENLISGLESGLFTSVDLVNAYVARIMEVGKDLQAPLLTLTHMRELSSRGHLLNQANV
jgi:amidase